MVKIKNIDTSYSQVFIEDEIARNSFIKALSVERPGWQYDYLVKIGRRSKFDLHFTKQSETAFLVGSGILEIPPIREILGLPNLEAPDTTEASKAINEIVETAGLPFAPYDYQTNAAIKALSKGKKLSVMCTGSGKSLTISLCLEHFRRLDYKGVLVVPNINLLTQFANDIKSYNLNELYDNIITFGGGSKKLKQLKETGESLKAGDLVITTWQSLQKLDLAFFDQLDYIICDEVHKFSSECTSELVLQTRKAKFKLGFTGTLPDSKSAKLKLIGLFGVPEVLVTPQDLIQAGRGTPIHITGIKLQHTGENSAEVCKQFEFLDKLKATIAIPERTQFIAGLASKMKTKSEGSTLVLYTLIEHGFEIFKTLWQDQIVDAPDFESMQAKHLYFMNGQTTAKDRERIRVAMDNDPEAILVANYALLSTGVNIKSLRYAIFASPVKSGVTVAQSLGRGIRLADNKQRFDVYDVVDCLGGVRIFQNQYSARKRVYAKCGYEVQERKEEL